MLANNLRRQGLRAIRPGLSSFSASLNNFSSFRNSGFEPEQEERAESTALVPFQEPQSDLVPFQTPQRSLVPFQTPQRSLVPFQTPQRSLVPFQEPQRSLVPFQEPESDPEPAEAEEIEALEPSNETFQRGNSTFRREFLLNGTSDTPDQGQGGTGESIFDEIMDSLIPGLSSAKALVKLGASSRREDQAQRAGEFAGGLVPIPGSSFIGQGLGQFARQRSLANQRRELEGGQLREIERDGQPVDRVVGSDVDLEREVLLKQLDDSSPPGGD